MKTEERKIVETAKEFVIETDTARNSSLSLAARLQAAARATLIHEQLPRNNQRAYINRVILLKTVFNELPQP